MRLGLYMALMVIVMQVVVMQVMTVVIVMGLMVMVMQVMVVRQRRDTGGIEAPIISIAAWNP